MELELFNTIFDAIKYNDADYNENGELERINNINDIKKEFIELKKHTYYLSKILNCDSNRIYKNIINSYSKYDFLQVYNRICYVLGISFAQLSEEYYDKEFFNDEQLKLIINDTYDEFYQFLKLHNMKQYVNDFCLVGIKDGINEIHQFDSDYQKKKDL